MATVHEMWLILQSNLNKKSFPPKFAQLFNWLRSRIKGADWSMAPKFKFLKVPQNHDCGSQKYTNN